MTAAALLTLIPTSQAEIAPVDLAGYPDEIHLSWIGDPSTTMAVTWRSCDASGPPRSVGWWGAGQNDSATFIPAQSEPAPRGRGWLHKAEMIELEPDSVYEYEVSGDNGVWSSPRTFRTASASMPPGGVSFTVNGDVGTSYMFADVGPVLQAIAAESAGLHIIAGDLTYADEVGGTEYDEYWFAQDLPLVAESRPVMVAWGNHEYYRDFDVSIETITRYFQLPKNGLPNPCNPFPSYTFRYAGIQFFMLDDPESPCFDRGGQRDWLEAELAYATADPLVKWTVAVLHQPPFSSSCHGSQPLNRFPEFDRFGVNLVVSGHDHNYERTWPVSWDGGQVAIGESPSAHPVYFVAGVGGSRAYDCATPNAWSAYHDPGLHFGYLRVSATEAQLVVEFIGKEAYMQDARFTVVDRFAIRR